MIVLVCPISSSRYRCTMRINPIPGIVSGTLCSLLHILSHLSHIRDLFLFRGRPPLLPAMALLNSIGLRKLKMVACLMLLLAALAFILPAALAFILPKLRTVSMPSIRLFLLVNLMIFILLLTGGYFDRKPEEQQKALVCAPVPETSNPERTIVVAASPSSPAAVPALTIDSKALVVSEPIDDSSIAQALVPVKAPTSYYGSEELVSCKSLVPVPVPASPSSSSPRRRKVVKKKKKLPAEEIKVGIDPNNMIIVSTPPDLPEPPAKLSVQNLEACSLDEFNRFCDSFVHVRRQEWRLSSRGG